MPEPDLRAPPGEAGRIVRLARSTLTELIGNPQAQRDAIAACEDEVPSNIASALTRLGNLTRRLSYRDGLMVALAHPLLRAQRVDVTHRPESGRTASDQLGPLLAELHIEGVTSAYQNIGKNQANLVRGNQPDWDQVLPWAAKSATIPQIQAAYRRVAAAIAATARTVLPPPRPRLAQLTFGRVMEVLSTMLNEPTQGMHDQYVVSALLDAVVQQESEELRVETKALNASDSSSGTAGDIEILRKRKLLEAVEVTANNWITKLDQVSRGMSASGLTRAHIVAKGVSHQAYGELRDATREDISILDAVALSSVLVAVLDRRGREHALLRLYGLLDRYTSPELVNRFVRRLWASQLAEPGTDIPGAL